MSEKQEIETNVIKPSLFIKNGNDTQRILPSLNEISMDSAIIEVSNYIMNNDGRFKSEEFKDILYSDAKELWAKFITEFKSVKYSLYLKEKEFNFLTECLRDRLEYDANIVFFAIDLTNMLGEWVTSSIKSDNDQGSNQTYNSYLLDATEATYLYHLLATLKMKGLTEETYIFAEILKRIAEISKIVSYYDTHAKNLSKIIQEWVASFDEEESNGVVKK